MKRKSIVTPLLLASMLSLGVNNRSLAQTESFSNLKDNGDNTLLTNAYLRKPISPESKLRTIGHQPNRRGVVTGCAAELTPTLGENSAYTLTEVSSPDGENVITTYDYNSETGDITAKYYRIDYKITEPTNNRKDNPTTDVNEHFVGNSSSNGGGAIYNYQGSGINIIGDFVGNCTDDYFSYGGGAIYNNYGTIVDITGDFIKNSAFKMYYGGAIYNKSGTIGDITGNFVGNYAGNGGAIYNQSGTIGDITGDFVGNCTDDYYSYGGGAIYNDGTIGSKDADGNVVGGIINSNFINNYAETTYGTARGGAIYTSNDLNIIADAGESVFSGNYTLSNGTRDDNAIYVSSSSATLTLKSTNNGSIVMKDNIDGTTDYNVDVTGDGTGSFYMLNDIRNANVTFNNTTVNTVNNEVHTYNFNSFAVTGDTKMVVDVDLANKTMDRITSSSYGTHNGNLKVVGMNILTDAVSEQTAIYFAETGLKNNVTNGTGNLPHNYQTTAYTPIYKYTVTYDTETVYDETLGEGGYFVFTRGAGNSSNPSESFNPSVLSSSVSTIAGAYGTQLQTFNYAFQHTDVFMNNPKQTRITEKYRNKYAVENAGVFSPIMTGSESNGYWIKPYATFENVPLKHGPKVQNILYGTLIGYDSPMESIKYGWDRVMTYYVGYNGSTQHYTGVDSYQNGGLLGTTMTLYKGNFFTATTLSVGATVGESQTMYGSESFTSLLAGIGNKTGYNIEFKEGRFIIQPSILLSYSFVNTFDYTNAAGVKINSDPMSAIQIAPTLRFIGNTKRGWQPYFAIGMVWNILAHNDVKANDVHLPNMYIKPYIQYGLGLQRRFGERFLAFGQAMIYNGGRNGVMLNAGLRWAIGK